MKITFDHYVFVKMYLVITPLSCWILMICLEESLFPKLNVKEVIERVIVIKEMKATKQIFDIKIVCDKKKKTFICYSNVI